jgi:hypothetical protein
LQLQKEVLLLHLVQYRDLPIGYGEITKEKPMRRYLIGVIFAMDYD